jgi:hypothetical protein
MERMAAKADTAAADPEPTEPAFPTAMWPFKGHPDKELSQKEKWKLSLRCSMCDSK